MIVKLHLPADLKASDVLTSNRQLRLMVGARVVNCDVTLGGLDELLPTKEDLGMRFRAIYNLLEEVAGPEKIPDYPSIRAAVLSAFLVKKLVSR